MKALHRRNVPVSQVTGSPLPSLRVPAFLSSRSCLQTWKGRSERGCSLSLQSHRLKKRCSLCDMVSCVCSSPSCLSHHGSCILRRRVHSEGSDALGLACAKPRFLRLERSIWRPSCQVPQFFAPLFLPTVPCGPWCRKRFLATRTSNRRNFAVEGLLTFQIHPKYPSQWLGFPRRRC